jgi:uncharacterized protein YktB (UPF0637 family)
MPHMAKKKAPGKAGKDRHKKRLQVALQPKVHALMQALAKKSTRPLRHEVHLAIIEHLRRAGVEVPQDVVEEI